MADASRLNPEGAPVGIATGTILLASEGREISPEAIAKAADLASKEHTGVHVLAVARIWGSAFGLPHPSLKPSPREIDQQRSIVAAAMDGMKRLGISVTGEVMSSRNAAKAIAARATEKQCLAIVMTADAEPHWLLRGLIWTHEPYRVRQFAKLPVHLVVDAATTANRIQETPLPAKA